MSLVLTVDIESYYDRDFSLSKMTTEEYIRDPRFETIGVGVKEDAGHTVWFSGTKKQTREFLNQYDWENATAVAHNAVFDMAILNWCYDIRPKRIIDTLSMARALGHGSVSLKALAEFYKLGVKGTEVVNALGKRRLDFTAEDLAAYGDYCRNDVELAYDLFLQLGDGFPLNELKLIDLTIRMFTEPVLELDTSILVKHLEDVKEKKASLMNKMLISKEQLMSNPKLADVLRSLGVEPPMKTSLTTGKETYAFAKNDEEFKALLEHENAIVRAVVAARLGVKSTLEETRTERFIGVAGRGSLPIPLRYYAAHTGRWGGDDKVNMQNLPRTSPLKKAILAPAGYVFIDSDSSQIEARTLAWLAGQDDLVTAFANGEDVYCIMASAIYGRTITKADVTERFLGKTVVLGCGYGTGWAKLQSTLKAASPSVVVNDEEAKDIINTYRTTYEKIPELWREAGDAIRAMINDQTAPLGREGVLVVEGAKGIRLPNGLYLRYPNLREREDEETGKREYVYDTKKGRAVIPTRLYGAKMVENFTQSLARIVIGEQMLKVARRYRPVMTVHDAIAVLAPKDAADEAQAYVEKCMKMRPTWGMELPLNCEAGYGASYGECK
jgi:DNA polymerase